MICLQEDNSYPLSVHTRSQFSAKGKKTNEEKADYLSDRAYFICFQSIITVA